VFIRDWGGHGDGGEGGLAIDGGVQSGSGAVVPAPKIEGDPFLTRLFVVAEPKVQGALAPSRLPARGPSCGNVADWGVRD